MERNQLILLISMVLSGIVVLAYNKLVQLNRKRYLKSAMKRYKIIREKEDRGEIKRRVVYFEENARANGEEIGQREIGSNKKSRAIINGESYTEDTSWFLMDDNVLYIYGKEEDFLIELHSELFDNY